MRTLTLLIPIITALCGCSSKPDFNKYLPQASLLGSPRGFEIVRTAIHLHSPYSYDACDSKGIASDGTVNAECLGHFRDAFCKNHVDFAFLTDHPSRMQDYEFSDLLLTKSGDQIETKNGAPYANHMGGCPDGFAPTLSVGFENRVMPIGMTGHLATDAATRSSLYQGETSAFVTQLKNTADAVVIVPHTESREDALLATLGMDAIEVYNFHANLDPKIRGPALGLDRFENLFNILVYWLDPYQEQEPDLAFLSFFEWASIYEKKWNTLLYAGTQVGGVAANDSHENTFPWGAHDGERLDSHRRMIRWVTNHYLVTPANHSLDGVKAAIRARRGWIVMEGLGSPAGMDFYATMGGVTTSVGDSLTYNGSSTVITVELPTLHSTSPAWGAQPEFHIVLKRVLSGGADTIVAQTRDTALTYSVTQTGVYRAIVYMKPRHLRAYLDFDADRSGVEYPWIITNPLFIL